MTGCIKGLAFGWTSRRLLVGNMSVYGSKSWSRRPTEFELHEMMLYVLSRCLMEVPQMTPPNFRLPKREGFLRTPLCRSFSR